MRTSRPPQSRRSTPSRPGSPMRSRRNPPKHFMTAFPKTALGVSFVVALAFIAAPAGRASVDDAQSFALQAAEPYVKDGYQVREDYWGGDLGSGEKKAVRQQLFKGNEYW